MIQDDAERLVPLAAEQIEVTRGKVALGAVRVETHSEERVETVDLELRRDDVEIERVAIGTPVEVMPQIRQEGDVTIIPIVEERVVLARQLVLKEEVRLRRVTRTEHRREQVVLRTQHAEIRRLGADDEPVGTVPTGETMEQNHAE